jgi:hypothetical protein
MENTVTVILPVYRLNDNEKDYFAKAVASVREQKTLPTKLMIVVPAGDKKLKETIEGYGYDDKIKEILTIVENDGETDFCSQVNFGVSKIDTKWFSVLEIDDEYSTIWFDNFYKYGEYHEDVEVFLPIVLDTDINGNFLHFTNEPVWAKDFSDKLGVLDNDALLNFPNFQIAGAVYNKESFESVGGFKPSIKLQFGYELFLRMTYYDKKIMTIPKIGYRKTNMRPESLFHGYYHSETEKLDPVEARWWFNTARKECYFKNDRGIKYEVNEEIA